MRKIPSWDFLNIPQCLFLSVLPHLQKVDSGTNFMVLLWGLRAFPLSEEMTDTIIINNSDILKQFPQKKEWIR
jgi:hypothetical protein